MFVCTGFIAHITKSVTQIRQDSHGGLAENNGLEFCMVIVIPFENTRFYEWVSWFKILRVITNPLVSKSEFKYQSKGSLNKWSKSISLVEYTLLSAVLFSIRLILNTGLL